MPNAPEDSSDFGWNVHAALDSWTAKVDSKASIVLGLETAIGGFIVALAGGSGPISKLTGGNLIFFKLGLLLLTFGVILAGGVVFPQLSRGRSKKIWSENFIYFGHLRHWDVAALEKRLTDISEATSLQQLSRQLVEMSKIAWRKHAWLQYSMSCTLIGVIIIIMSAA